MTFSFETLALILISLVLLLLAAAATYFIIQEVIHLVADIGQNRVSASEDDEPVSEGARRIKPFRDRGTVERLIGYFRQDKN